MQTHTHTHTHTPHTHHTHTTHTEPTSMVGRIMFFGGLWNFGLHSVPPSIGTDSGPSSLSLLSPFHRFGSKFSEHNSSHDTGYRRGVKGGVAVGVASEAAEPRWLAASLGNRNQRRHSTSTSRYSELSPWQPGSTYIAIMVMNERDGLSLG